MERNRSGLVISRKPGETLVIGEGENEVVVRVLPRERRGGGSRIRLHVSGPRSVPIIRGELMQTN